MQRERREEPAVGWRHQADAGRFCQAADTERSHLHHRLVREVEEVARGDMYGEEEGGIFSDSSSFYETDNFELDSESDDDELSGLQLVECMEAMAIDHSPAFGDESDKVDARKIQARR